MAFTLTRGKTFSVNEQVTNTKLHLLVEGATAAGIDRTNMATGFSGIHISSSAPGTPQANEMWWDSTNLLLKRYNLSSTRWDLASAGALKGYIYELVVAWKDVATVTISAGQCVDATGADLMVLAANQDVALSGSGANGLDTGAEAANTWYYVWLIKNPTTGTVAGLFSASASAPTMPSGYTLKRLIGACRNNASSNLLQHKNRGKGSYRKFIYSSIQGILSGGGETSYTDVNCAAEVPPSCIGIFGAHSRDTSTPSSGTCTTNIRTNGLSDEGVQILHRQSNAGATGGAYEEIELPVDASSLIEYKSNTNDGDPTLDIFGLGYVIEV